MRQVAYALAGVGCCCAAACGGHATPPSAIYWTQSAQGGADEPGTVGRARLDGSAANGRLVVGAKAPAGIAFDGRFVYWANYGSDTIARGRLDGSHVDERFIDDAYAIGVAVDDRHVYWTSGSTIGRANLDGTRVERRFIRAGDSPVGLAVHGDYVYWTHDSWNPDQTVRRYAIGRARRDGSDIDLHFVEVSNKIVGVAVNDRYVYWSNSAEDVMGRANLDGSGVVQRCITPRDVPLGNVPEGMAVDGAHVYWTNYPANTIARANLDGSNLDERFIVVDGVPEGIAVASKRRVGPASACRERSKPPILFGPTEYRAGYYAVGWGEVAPPTISNGGAAASGTVFDIHWRSWGGKVALGRGLHPEYTPHGGYYAKPLVMEVRASGLGRCRPGGRLVYTRFTYREQVRPGGRMGKRWSAWVSSMCGGR